MDRKKLLKEFAQSRKKLESLQQELTSTNELMEPLQRDPKIQEYLKLLARRKKIASSVNQLKDDLYWQNILCCDHMMFPSSCNEPDYEMRKELEFDCCRCDLTSRFNDDLSRMGDYFYKMKEMYLKVFPGFYPPSFMKICNGIINPIYARELYKRAIKLVGVNDKERITKTMFELKKQDEQEKEKAKQRTHQLQAI